MVANTFEAYDARYLGRRTGLAVGYIDKMKTKSSDTFQSMSDVAGVPGSDKGVATIAAIAAPSDNVNIGAIDFYGFDLFNTFYTQANFTSAITDELELGLSGQFIDQRSVGDALLGSFDTQNGGARAAVSYKGAILNVAFNTTSNGAAIRSPWGGYPGFASQMERDFDRAGEMPGWLGCPITSSNRRSKGSACSVVSPAAPARAMPPPISPCQMRANLILPLTTFHPRRFSGAYGFASAG